MRASGADGLCFSMLRLPGRRPNCFPNQRVPVKEVFAGAVQLMRLVCRGCGYPYRPMKGLASQCPKCGTPPSKADALWVGTLAILTVVVVITLAANGNITP